MWAIASIRNEAPSVLALLPTVAGVMPEVMPHLNAQELANTYWALATLYQHEPDSEVSGRLLDLCPTLLASLEAQLAFMKAQELANTVWSMSILRTVAPKVTGFTSVFARGAAQLLENAELHPTDRTLGLLTHARLLWGLAGLDHRDDHLMGLVAQDILKRAPDAKGRDLLALIDILCAFARLEFKDMKVLEVAVPRLITLKMQRLRDWDICALSWALDRLCAKEFFTEFRSLLGSEIAMRGIPQSQVEQSWLGPESWNPLAQTRKQQ